MKSVSKLAQCLDTDLSEDSIQALNEEALLFYEELEVGISQRFYCLGDMSTGRTEELDTLMEGEWKGVEYLWITSG